MTTGVWPQVSGDISDSDERPREASMPSRVPRARQLLGLVLVWALGLTQRGRPPRDTTARTRRRLLGLVLAWALAGAGVLRVVQLLGGG